MRVSIKYSYTLLSSDTEAEEPAQQRSPPRASGRLVWHQLCHLPTHSVRTAVSGCQGSGSSCENRAQQTAACELGPACCLSRGPRAPKAFSFWRPRNVQNSISFHWDLLEMQPRYPAALTCLHSVCVPFCYQGRVEGWPPSRSGLLACVELWPQKS